MGSRRSGPTWRRGPRRGGWRRRARAAPARRRAAAPPAPPPPRVAVRAVAEGILQVARYRNPTPLAHFFQKRRLEVDTRQILDLILPDFKRFLAPVAAGRARATA